MRLTSVHLLLALTTIGGSLAYVFPSPFVAASFLVPWAFGCTMFLVGLTVPPEEIIRESKSPRGLLSGLIAQYTIMPITAWLAVAAFDLPQPLELGILLVGCVPGAMTSNVITFIVGGPTTYSVALTTMSSLFAPVVTPTLFLLLAGEIVDVPFLNMLQSILFIMVLPLCAGILAGPRVIRRLGSVRRLIPVASSISIAFICANAFAASHQHLADASLRLLLALITLNGVGYLSGWVLGTVFRMDRGHRFALTIEIGMQNGGLGAVLAITHLDTPAVSLPCVLYAFGCVVTASILASSFQRRSTDDSAG